MKITLKFIVLFFCLCFVLSAFVDVFVLPWDVKGIETEALRFFI